MGTDGVGRDWLGAMEGEGVLGLGLGTPLSPRRWRWVSCVVDASLTRVLVHSLTRVLVHSSLRVLVHSSLRVLVVFLFPCHVVVVSSSHGLFVVLWCCPRSQQGGLRGRWDGWYLLCPRIKGGCTSLLSFEWW